ncbi:MAG: PAS domain-containing protein [Clostridia bacterium]|nr:PAS domain-containing protein [Clostridia bacterium]
MRKEVQTVSLGELNILGNLIATPLIVMTADEVLYINDLFTAMTGYDMEDLIKSGFQNTIATDQQYKFFIRLSKVLKGKKYHDMNEFRLRCKDGSWMCPNLSLILVT